MLNKEDKLASWYHGQRSFSSGIPSTKYKYNFQGNYQDDFGHLFDQMFPYQERIYSTAFKDGIIIFDRHNGVIAESKALERYKDGSGSMRHNGKYLFADPYILDLNTLEIAYDPWPEIDKTGIKIGLGHGFITDKHVVREINVKTHPGVWWFFDLEKWQGKILSLDVSRPHSMYHHPDQIVCVCGSYVQIRDLISMDLIAEKEIPDISYASSHPAGIIVKANHGKKITDNVFSQYFLNDQTLETIGVIGAASIDKKVYCSDFEDIFSPISPKTSGNYDEHIAQVCAYNWKTQVILWRSEPFRSVSRSWVGGDIIFACVDRNCLVALDKWSGELLWQAEEPYEPMSAHFYQNHVYFMDMGGNLCCYEWENEYISPNRPSDPEMAWICPDRTSL